MDTGNLPTGSEVRVVSASVVAQLQAQGLQVRLYKFKNISDYFFFTIFFLHNILLL